MPVDIQVDALPRPLAIDMPDLSGTGVRHFVWALRLGHFALGKIFPYVLTHAWNVVDLSS